MRVELTVHPPDGVTRVLPLHGQLTLGRGPENDVVIPNLRVSWSHALVWDDGEVVFVTDLGTRNGTLLDGLRVKESAAFPVGSRLEVGDVGFTVQPTAAVAPASGRRALALEHLGTGVRYPLRSTFVRIGDSRDADLRIPGREHVTVVCHPDGHVWVARGPDDEFLAEGEVFEVSGVGLRVVPAETRWTTANDDDTCLYEVVVSPESNPPWARVRCARTSKECLFTVANRVALLHHLVGARALGDGGWRSNTAVAVGLWGKVGALQDPRALRSVVHHVRT